jgi:hypothetical protein
MAFKCGFSRIVRHQKTSKITKCCPIVVLIISLFQLIFLFLCKQNQTKWHQ